MGFCIRLRKLERVLLPLNSEKKNRRNGRTFNFSWPCQRAEGTGYSGRMGSNEGQSPDPRQRAGRCVHLSEAPTMGRYFDLSYHFKELLETKCGLTCWSGKCGAPNSEGLQSVISSCPWASGELSLGRRLWWPLLSTGSEEGIRGFSLKKKTKKNPTESTSHPDPLFIQTKSLK